MSYLAGDALLWICPLWEAGDPIVLSLGAFLVAFRKVFDKPRPAAPVKSSQSRSERRSRRAKPVRKPPRQAMTVCDPPVPLPVKAATLIEPKKTGKSGLAKHQSKTSRKKGLLCRCCCEEHLEDLCPGDLKLQNLGPVGETALGENNSLPLKSESVPVPCGSFGPADVLKLLTRRSLSVIPVPLLQNPVKVFGDCQVLLMNSPVLKGKLQLQIGALYTERFVFHLLTSPPVGRSEPVTLLPVPVQRPSVVLRLELSSLQKFLVPKLLGQPTVLISSPSNQLAIESRCADLTEVKETVASSPHTSSVNTCDQFPGTSLSLKKFSMNFGKKMLPVMIPCGRADSVTWNPHKLLGVGLQCSAFLLRDTTQILEQCHAAKATYLFQTDKFYDLKYDTGDKSIQCGRRVDCLKLWLMWKALGSKGLEGRVDGVLDQTRYLAEEMKKREGFRLVMEPEFVNLCFWYVPPSLRNQENSLDFWTRLGKVAPVLKERMMKKGSMMVGYQPHGHRVNFFRQIVVNPDVTKEDLDFFLDEIERLAEDL
ncbi:unnamed protein product [Ranitomeya imitator]|uniref:Cysteine sulfinic acid decarboxylase n=1 Tax=Ranitomeya imitator TaxID=111125 RepID=A0ABN9LDU1_9NEOB|nr:unnamed protein product [Ranitomeya imitator]